MDTRIHSSTNCPVPWTPTLAFTQSHSSPSRCFFGSPFTLTAATENHPHMPSGKPNGGGGEGSVGTVLFEHSQCPGLRPQHHIK